jgi:hypothetical protein
VSTQAYRHEAQDAPPGKARRRNRVNPRVVVRCGCWLEHDGATVYGSTVDLGRGGRFLRTALPMPPGVAVRVTLHLPELGSVEAEGHVVHRIAPSEAERPGLGVRFDRLTHGDDALAAFLGLEPEPGVPLLLED